VELARDTGYLKIDSKMIISIEEIWKYSDNQLVIITTGSQGEPFSGLVTMSRGENKLMDLGEHDVVFLLASVIPGNEKLVNSTINRLFARGCEVVYERDRQIHVSGHASAEELKIMLNLTRPQYFVPIHGEYKHMVRHSQLAQETGILPRNIYLLTNGDVLTFTGNTPPKKHGHVQAGAVIVDGNAAGSIKSEVLKERREIAEDGVMAVAVTVDERGRLISPVAIETQGVFISDDGGDIFRELYAVSEQAVQEFSGVRANPEALKKAIKTRVRDVLRKGNTSFAVVMPIVSVKKPDNTNIYEKEFF
ncbi:MAG: ribonuclease J, partial [Synergistaceae bacterium]|nr:ribonuclease J [Synergistaceae bacterium]